jgi:hypothetical protein
MTRRVFLSFDAEDNDYVNLFRGQAKNSNLEIDFYDSSLKEPIESKNADYIKSKIRPKIDSSSVILCLIGYNSHKSGWIAWELLYSELQKKGIVGVRLHSSNQDIIPQALKTYGAKIVDWDHQQIALAIESAAKKAGY